MGKFKLSGDLKLNRPVTGGVAKKSDLNNVKKLSTRETVVKKFGRQVDRFLRSWVQLLGAPMLVFSGVAADVRVSQKAGVPVFSEPFYSQDVFPYERKAPLRNRRESFFEDSYSYGESFENTVISNTDYYYGECTFKNVSFDNDMMSIYFENCQFTNISLESVNFIDSEFDRCNFSDSSLNVEIVNSRFSNNHFNGAVFSNDDSVHIPWSVGANSIDGDFTRETKFLNVRNPIQNFDSEQYLSNHRVSAFRVY